MGFSSPHVPQDHSAELARADEARRQVLIDQGTGQVDRAYAPFNDAYYSGVEHNYTDYYLPQLQDQYNKAQQKLTLSLAGSGNLGSSTGATQFADLLNQFNQQRTSIADAARGSSADLRGRVDASRQNAYDFNTSAADPSRAASSASAQAGALQAPAQYSPLGNVFADFLNTAAAGVSAERQGFRGLNTGLFNSNPAGGSSRSSGGVIH